MIKNEALQMFIESIDRKIDESQKVENTLNNLLRLIEILVEVKKVNYKIGKAVKSISNNCVYSKYKLNKVKEDVCRLYRKLDSLGSEYKEIEESIPVNAKYHTCIGTTFEVKKSLTTIEKGNLSSAKYFIRKFKYELENEELYKDNTQEK